MTSPSPPPSRVSLPSSPDSWSVPPCPCRRSSPDRPSRMLPSGSSSPFSVSFPSPPIRSSTLPMIWSLWLLAGFLSRADRRSLRRRSRRRSPRSVPRTKPRRSRRPLRGCPVRARRPADRLRRRRPSTFSRTAPPADLRRRSGSGSLPTRRRCGEPITFSTSSPTQSCSPATPSSGVQSRFGSAGQPWTLGSVHGRPFPIPPPGLVAPAGSPAAPDTSDRRA